jgi:2,3-dihydroxybenzoate-AMP ligase
VTPVADGTVPWPRQAVDRYVSAGYWSGRPLGAHLLDQVDRTPDAIALRDPDTGVTLTYRQVAGRADAAASRLAALGIGAGDRMVLALPNCWEFVVLTVACWRAGAIPVMALPAHRRPELTHLAAVAEAAAIAVPDEHRGFDHQAMAAQLVAERPELRNVLVRGRVNPGNVDVRALCAPAIDAAGERDRWDAAAPSSRDVAVFLVSGGTTGLPKLIARTHDDYGYNARASAAVAAVDGSSVYLVALPAGHNFPLACPGILGTLLCGGRVVMLASPEPAGALATIAAEGVTHTAVVPAVAGRWLEHREADPSEDISSLTVIQVGGARIVDELARRIEPVLGARLQQVFGMAEGLLNFTRLDDPDDVICTTQGRPLCPDDEILLVDEDDRPVPPGQAGSLLTRGPYTPRGYFRAAEHNARSFTPDGWYRTGDICRLTPEGNLIVEGRDKDMINRGGEKISAEEVENLVHHLPSVSQVAAVAMPDRGLGERVCVYVVARPGAAVTLEEIRDAMERVGVARFKLPEHLVITDRLPTTDVGKVDKKSLRADITGRLATEAERR